MNYQSLIQQATGETDAQKLADIEECMRQDIFHSTLDWQTREQLASAARQAAAILLYAQTHDPDYDGSDKGLPPFNHNLVR